jgi:hypothetical protein
MSLARFRSVAKRSQMHPNEKKRTKTWVYGPIVWIVSIRCEKLWHNFVAQNFTLIAPVWRILQQVSCSSETVPNVPKRKGRHETHETRVQLEGSGAFVVKNSNKTS